MKVQVYANNNLCENETLLSVKICDYSTCDQQLEILVNTESEVDKLLCLLVCINLIEIKY